MQVKHCLVILMTICSIILLPSAYATPSVQIIMDQTTYKYCEKLFYIIEVSEITGDSAVIHLRDEAGKGSNAIPISINKLQTLVPSVIPFEAEIFPLGKYFIDVEYAGAKDSAEFNLVDSKNICIPSLMKQITDGWVNSKISDGFFIDAIKRYVNAELITIPNNLSEKNIEDIHIPTWLKNTAEWWLEGKISDAEFAQAIQYLVKTEIII